VARFCHRRRARLALVASSTRAPTCSCPRRRTPARAGRGPKGPGCPSPAGRGRPGTVVPDPTDRRVVRRGPGGWPPSRAPGTGHRYKSGRGLVPVRRVFAQDLTGTHRDEYFFATDPAPGQAAVGERHTGRWNLETTSQGCRSCLGLETTRGWCRATALRAAPCLFGLYSVPAALYHLLPGGQRAGRVEWPGKSRGDVLGRSHGRPPVAAGRRGFPTGGRAGGGPETPARLPGTNARRPRHGHSTSTKPHQSSLRDRPAICVGPAGRGRFVAANSQHISTGTPARRHAMGDWSPPEDDVLLRATRTVLGRRAAGRPRGGQRVVVRACRVSFARLGPRRRVERPTSASPPLTTF
jgi:hypothetical protein